MPATYLTLLTPNFTRITTELDELATYLKNPLGGLAEFPIGAAFNS